MSKLIKNQSFKVSLTLFILFQLPIFLYTQNQIAYLPDGKKVILYEDNTWAYQKGISYDFDFDQLMDNQIPDFLRHGIDVDKKILKIGVEMYLQGWRFTMPRPKSDKAEWGIRDGRTTWWNGYWYNIKTLEYSRTTPQKQANGYYDGDEQDESNSWRNGGSPNSPSVFNWLLSTSGGIKPKDSEKKDPKLQLNRQFN